RPANDRDGGVERGRRRRQSPAGKRLLQAGDQRAEGKAVEEVAHLLGVVGLLPAVGPFDGELGVGDETNHLAVAEHLLTRFVETLAGTGRHLVEVLVDALEVLVLLEERGRRLLAHPRSAREVVAVVTSEGGVLAVLVGTDSVT